MGLPGTKIEDQEARVPRPSTPSIFLLLSGILCLSFLRCSDFLGEQTHKAHSAVAM